MAKNKTEYHKCYDCAKAYLMQSHTSNPVVAQCYTGERHVASTPNPCQAYRQSSSEPAIHEMIYLK